MSKWVIGNVSMERVAVQVVVMPEGKSSVDGAKVKGKKENNDRGDVC